MKLLHRCTTSFWRRCAGILPVLVLVACGSSPPVYYYSLHPMESEFQPDSDNPVILGLGPIRLPEYLNRSQIVVRGANAEIQVDEYNLWAEPLETSLHRILAADIDNLLTDVVVVVFPYETAVQRHVNFRLIGDISRFEASADGRVVLDVQWTVASRDDEILISPRRSHFEAQALEPMDTNAIVTAMNDVIGQFGSAVASQLENAFTR